MWALPPDNDPWLGPHTRAASALDVQLTLEVHERLFAEAALADDNIVVGVQNRVVTLMGTVSCPQARVVAAATARETPGVTDMCNRLQVRRTDEHPTDDFDELTAGWEEDPHEKTDAARRRELPSDVLTSMVATLVTIAAAAPVILLPPPYSGIALLIVLPATAVTVIIAGLAGARSASRSARAGRDSGPI